MNYSLKMWAIVGFFMHILVADASAPAVSKTQILHEINEKIQKLQEEYAQIGQKIVLDEKELQKLIKRNEDKEGLSKELEQLKQYFKTIKDLEKEKMIIMDDLSADGTMALSDRKKKERRIRQLDEFIDAQYDFAFMFSGGSDNIQKIVKAKIEKFRHLMRQSEIRLDIERTVEVYRKMRDKAKQFSPKLEPAVEVTGILESEYASKK